MHYAAMSPSRAVSCYLLDLSVDFHERSRNYKPIFKYDIKVLNL